MQYTAIIAIDLGQAADYSALSLFFRPIWAHERDVLRVALPAAGWLQPEQVTPHQLEQIIADQPSQAPHVLVKDVRRWPLGTKYPAIVADIWRLLGTLPHPTRTALVIDKTGVGAGVYDMFEDAGLAPIGVTITGGQQVVHDGDRQINVPKIDLIGAAQKLLQQNRLRFAARATGLPQLREELQNFRLKVNLRTGNTSMEAWRERDHDDLVLSLALGCWFLLYGETHAAWSARDLSVLAGRAV